MPSKNVWAALVFSNGVSDVFGATRGADRLHWTRKEVPSLGRRSSPDADGLLRSPR